MNLSIKFCSAIILTLFANIFPQDCKGTIMINTDDPNSIIIINDSLKATGKTILTTEAGSYKIKAKRSVKSWDDIVFTDSLNLKCDEEKVFNYSFKSAILLQTDPYDAGVYNSDSLIGHTPLYIPFTSNNLILMKPGYETKIINPLEIQIGMPVVLNFFGKTKKESFYEKSIFKYLMGGIVALGAVTAYYKIKADKKFEEYQITGEPALLNKTRQYDLISGITMGAMQINFGVLIYFFLAE